MKREMCAGLLTVTLAATGYGAYEAAKANIPQGVDAAVMSEFDPQHILNLSDIALGSTLPPSVANEVDTATSITIRNAPLVVTEADGTKSNLMLSGYASGVRIDDNEVLTAGHVGILDASSSKTASNPYICTDEFSRQPLADPENPADDEKAQTGAGIRNQADDVALLRVPSDPEATHIESLGSTPQTGDPLYFVNYEPTADGYMRQPGVSTAIAAEDYTKPAILGGVAYKLDGDHLLVIDDVGRNYGEGAPDVEIRPGASGGPVFSDDGLVGLSVAAYPKVTAHEIEDTFGGVQVHSDHPDEQYQVAVVQLITPNLIHELREGMQSCLDNTPFTDQAQN
ncbi:MAG TPA: trypsin-like peptidase domain-containing protein [Candidatus Saccharimonadales bacterium]|jgi:hypothetical protein|nr:trypsin-like peptidase domain-containing protein [Candidatus Saccharimonadales bacterium]